MVDNLTPRDLWAIETMSRQAAVVDEAATAAVADGDPVSGCRRWLAVERQAAGYERYLQPWRRSGAFERVMPDIEGHREALRRCQSRARSEVAGVDGEMRRWARRGLGLRIGVVGKGGAGKTVLSGTMARLLARQGRQVLAVDLDTNPGLAFSLGLPLSEAGLPPDAVEQDPGANYGWQLAAGMTPDDVVDRYSTRGPDGVRFLGVGKISSIEKEAAKHSVAALVQVLLGFGRPDWDVVADLEAGPTTPFERYHGFASDTVVVVGPAWRSAMTARRLWPMVESQRPVIVANRFRDEPDHPGLEAWARIPDDPEVAEAERLGLAPIDVCPDAPAVRAISELTGRLLAEVGAPGRSPTPR
jgi:CO dehydrogenase maturation factor